LPLVLCLSQVLVPSNKAQASLSVAVRVRPTLKSEQQAAGSSSSKRDIIRVMDGKIVVVLDPDEAKDYLDQVQNRTKEKRYTFDVAYDTQVRTVITMVLQQKQWDGLQQLCGMGPFNVNDSSSNSSKSGGGTVSSSSSKDRVQACLLCTSSAAAQAAGSVSSVWLQATLCVQGAVPSQQ
jgi:hypothetical protein